MNLHRRKARLLLQQGRADKRNLSNTVYPNAWSGQKAGRKTHHTERDAWSENGCQPFASISASHSGAFCPGKQVTLSTRVLQDMTEAECFCHLAVANPLCRQGVVFLKLRSLIFRAPCSGPMRATVTYLSKFTPASFCPSTNSTIDCPKVSKWSAIP